MSYCWKQSCLCFPRVTAVLEFCQKLCHELHFNDNTILPSNLADTGNGLKSVEGELICNVCEWTIVSSNSELTKRNFETVKGFHCSRFWGQSISSFLDRWLGPKLGSKEIHLAFLQLSLEREDCCNYSFEAARKTFPGNINVLGSRNFFLFSNRPDSWRFSTRAERLVFRVDDVMPVRLCYLKTRLYLSYSCKLFFNRRSVGNRWNSSKNLVVGKLWLRLAPGLV